MLRLSSVVRLAAVAFVAIFFLHFLASFFSSAPDPSPYYDANQYGADLDDGIGWGERLGLDHYASWEEDVRGKVGAGLGRIKDGVGSITGLGAKGPKLGSLYELVATSNPSPGPAYFDARTSMDRLKLTSTRVLGHGGGSSSGSSDGAEDVDDAAFADRQRRHILVTGGFGSLGKAVVRDLLLTGGGSSAKSAAEWAAAAGAPADEQAWEADVLVTILDANDRTSELNFLLQSAPLDKPGASGKAKGTDPRAKAFQASERSVDSFRKQGKLRVVVGDVRDSALVGQLLDPKGSYVTHLPGHLQAAALGDVPVGAQKQKGHGTTTSFIPPVTGIIHLAAYSPSHCRQNPGDCKDVEAAGMKALLAGIEREGVDEEAALEGDKAVAADRPWVVVARRADRWDEASLAHNGNASALSMQASEAALKTFTHDHPLHALLLQLPSAFSIVGDPFAPRFDPVPHIVQSALGNLPVAVTSSATQTEPFLALDDASRAVVQGARMLDVASSKDYLRLLGFVGEVEVVGPPSASRSSRASSSSSPLAELAQTAIALIQSQSPFAALEQPRAPVASPSDGKFHVSETAHRKTASKALGFTPAISVEAALRTYISALLRLQTTYLSSRINVACSSPPSISVLEEGLLAMNGCNVQLLTLVEGAYYTLGCSQGLEGDHDEPVSLVSAVPYKEGVRGVEITAERGLEGKVDIQMRCPVVGKDGKLVSGESEVVMWADTPTGGEFAELSREGAHEIAEWFTVEFAQRDARSFTLTLPPTEGVPDGEEPKRRLTFREPNANRKSLLFQPTGDDGARALLWKFNPICCAASERRKDVWDFFHEDPLLTSQVSYPSEDGRTTLAESTLAIRKCHDLRAEHDRIAKIQLRFKHSAAKAASGAVQASSSSSSSGDMCVPKYGAAGTWTAKDEPTCSIDCSAPLPCVASEHCKCTRDRCGDARGAGPFPAVAYTDAKSFPASSTPPAQSLAERVDNHLKSPACYDLDRSPLPFMGDHYFVEALRNRSVGLDDAAFVMVPYYQGCYYNYLQENTFKKLAETIGHAEKSVSAADHITGERIVVPFTHDFGSCTGWWPKLEDVLGHSPPSPMDQAVAWQVNGDYNTRCVKADRDVVVPAVTKHTKSLFETFKTAKDVKPVLDRKHLAFFAGGVRGFGALPRTKIGCGRTGQDAESADILYQQFSPGLRYLGTLSASKFCLLPRGIPAWTTRTFEAIYSGCIPAFIVDRNMFPFQDILDYSKFSVTIPEADAHRVDEVLGSYSDTQLVELQAHLVKVRDAFLFADGQEWDRQGPLFFALVSMAMRLPLGYPEVGSCPAS
ncbi:glycosyltransferase family 47 protein [Rhodotorula graminis WP1]|uniref:Glycosyltransferase family 47 protein n=1 Tax=Rhodotorula graminis (strain WP1) TaxID=578459 RepID=A0A194S5T6_RHOGW|nr:glycosyltransferase family 47 protein [Rhodotorula graminis WP1]KPV75947.1 glycosyltransferase family 47 protein [Rhodotorula graminis WP1]